jgi:hypothetical protein
LGAAALCATAPAAAQDLTSSSSSSSHSPGLTGLGRVTPGRAPPLASPSRRIRFSNEGLIRQDGSPGDRRAVVGSMPLVGPIAAEVGLFSVSGASPKEREVKQGDRMTDVQPRRSRVAAIGLRMSF